MSTYTRAFAAVLISALIFSAEAIAASTTIGPGTLPEAGEVTGFQSVDGQQGQGQTFIVPTGYPILRRIEFWQGVSNYVDGSTFTFEIYSWDGTTTVGSPVFSSVVPAITSSDPYFQGALGLVEGASYLAFLRTATDTQPIPGRAIDSNGAPVEVYSDGFWVYQDQAGVYQSLIVERTETRGPFDLRFGMVFDDTAVPEPATVSMLSAGLVGIVVASRRRRA